MPEQTYKLPEVTLLKKLTVFCVENGAEFVPDERELNAFAVVFEDADLVNTCFCLFENDLNVSRTAAALYMHRNTLLYRINKIKRLAGLNVCKFSDGVKFIFYYRAYRLRKEKKLKNLR